MAVLAEGNEAIEVEVRAAARALEDMVNVEAATATARLASPARAAAHLAADRLCLPVPLAGRLTGRRVSLRREAPFAALIGRVPPRGSRRVPA